MIFRTLALASALFAAAVPVVAQEAVLIIRHGEKQAGEDPGLTGAGRARAARWAVLAREAGIDAVLTSDARRTRETGTIIADTLGVSRAERPVDDTAGLVDLITFDHAEDTVLVVAHTETIPGLLAGLGVVEPVTVEQDDFASLFVVTGFEGDPVLVRLRMP